MYIQFVFHLPAVSSDMISLYESSRWCETFNNGENERSNLFLPSVTGLMVVILLVTDNPLQKFVAGSSEAEYQVVSTLE